MNLKEIKRINILSHTVFNKEQVKLLENERKYRNILFEKRGSFPDQYKIATNVLEKIIKTIENNKNILKRDTDGFYNVIVRDKTEPLPLIKYSFKWGTFGYDSEKLCKGETNYDKDENIPIIKLTVNDIRYDKSNIITTLAHELMHCYQGYVKSFGNIDEFFYFMIPSFIRDAPTNLMSEFFYAIYITFPHEMNANVSSIESLLFQNKDNGKTIKELLENCDKYTQYKEVHDFFTNQRNLMLTERDIKYLYNCLCKEQEVYDIKSTILNPQTDIKSYFYKKVKEIIKKCDYVLKKMHKNTSNFTENN